MAPNGHCLHSDRISNKWMLVLSHYNAVYTWQPKQDCDWRLLFSYKKIL